MARYVKLDNLVGFSGEANFVGLSEVQIYGVPEPASIRVVGARRRRVAVHASPLTRKS